MINESLIQWGNQSHVRQLRECVDGQRYPMFPAEVAYIELDDNLYVAKTARGDIIGISDNIHVVINRIRFAQPNVLIYVRDGADIPIEEYLATLEPVIYRVTHGNSELSGQIIVLDYIKDGRHSEIKMFDTAIQAERFIQRKQGDVDYYYVFVRRPLVLGLDAGGLDYYELSKEQYTTTRLGKVLQEERKLRNEREAK